MKVGVYNRYWNTAGGGEKYAGSIAQVLSADHDVDLLVHEPFDVDWLDERLRVDLRGTKQVLVDDAPRAIATLTEDYDLFVNASYMSSNRSRARRSMYVVYFPTSKDSELSRARRAAARAYRAARRDDGVQLEWGEGFHSADSGRFAAMWTDGDGVFRLTLPPGATVPVEIVLGYQRPQGAPPAAVRVEVDGVEVASATVGEPPSRASVLRGLPVRFEISGPPSGDAVEVRIRSDVFVPADLAEVDDHRRLGVPVRTIRIGRGPASWVAAALPSVLSAGGGAPWTETYDRLVSISEYTRHWVERLWGRTSDLLWPPVTQYQPRPKQPVILSVGRFFEAHEGHSKKQLEMVRAFRKLCDAGVSGWTLHLVGGCAPRAEPYLADVRAAATGYPVELHVNAPGATVAELYGEASIYWHAAGLGENVERNPHRFEHFGITTVEAMSAGAVPVVFAGAGQLETVRHGVDGYHFRQLDDLHELTQYLIRDRSTAARMASNARTRARDFSTDAFAARLRAIVDDVVDADSGDRT